MSTIFLFHVSQREKNGYLCLDFSYNISQYIPVMAREKDPQKKEKEDILLWLKTIGRNTTWLASHIGKTENTVKGILYGTKRLTKENAEKIDSVRTAVSFILNKINDTKIPDDHPLAKNNPAFNPSPFSKTNGTPCTFYVTKEVYDGLTLRNGWSNYLTKEALSDTIISSLTSLLKDDLYRLRSRNAIVHPLGLHYFKKEIITDTDIDLDPEVLDAQISWYDSKYYDYVILPEEIYKYANTACKSLNEEHLQTIDAREEFYPSLYDYTDDYINSLLAKIMLKSEDEDLDAFLAD